MGFGKLHSCARPARADERLLLELAVADHVAVADRERVARAGDDALDEVDVGLLGGGVGHGCPSPSRPRTGRSGPCRAARCRPRRRMEDDDLADLGSLKRLPSRLTSTRWPTFSVGTIDSLGIRYGLTRNAWMPSASPSATATMTTSSTSWPPAVFSALAFFSRRPDVSRLLGVRRGLTLAGASGSAPASAPPPRLPAPPRRSPSASGSGASASDASAAPSGTSAADSSVTGASAAASSPSVVVLRSRHRRRPRR